MGGLNTLRFIVCIMIIRPLKPEEKEIVSELIIRTIRETNSNDYTQDAVNRGKYSDEKVL